MVANTKQTGARGDLTRRVARAGGMSLAKRLLKTIPFVGTGVALGLAGYEIKKKGLRNGLSPAGLPIGMQLLGPHWSESTLFRFAHAYEQAQPFTARPRVTAE